MAKLNPLSGPQKKVINAIAMHMVAHGMANHLKELGYPNTDEIIKNHLDSFTPKQNQIVRELNDVIKKTKAELAEHYEKDVNNGTA